MAARVVFFDFGGTIAVSEQDPVEMWLAFAGRGGVGVERSALERAHAEATARFTPALYDHLGRMREFWMTFDGYILRRLGIPDPDRRIASAIYRGFRDETRYTAFPDTRPALETLRAEGYALGVISNATEEMEDHLRAMGLAEYFDSITFSQEARAQKPQPEIFQLALRRVRCAPDEAVHVGNTYEDDVVGARAVGIAPILLDRDGRHPDVDCPQIPDLTRVSPLLKGNVL